jgi:hypothetical protein
VSSSENSAVRHSDDPTPRTFDRNGYHIELHFAT